VTDRRGLQKRKKMELRKAKKSIVGKVMLVIMCVEIIPKWKEKHERRGCVSFSRNLR